MPTQVLYAGSRSNRQPLLDRTQPGRVRVWLVNHPESETCIRVLKATTIGACSSPKVDRTLTVLQLPATATDPARRQPPWSIQPTYHPRAIGVAGSNPEHGLSLIRKYHSAALKGLGLLLQAS